MSEIFHKNCYMTRSSGYKYRTLSTNTGYKKHRDVREDNLFERKFRELQRDITTRIDSQMDKTQAARRAVQTKMEKIETKLNSMLELQDVITSLRQDLSSAELAITRMLHKVNRIDYSISNNPSCTSKSRKSIVMKEPISEEVEIVDSTVTHI